MAGVSVGSLFATLTLDKAAFDKSIQGAGSSWGNLAGAALKAGAVIATAFIGFGAAAAHSADVQERADKRVMDSLGASGAAFIKWAKDNAFALRKNDDDLEQWGATAVQAFRGMGFSMADSVTMTQTLMQRSADISAATGKSFDEVFEALLKGTEGATRGLKGLGIVIDPLAVKEKALSDELWSGEGGLSAAAKAAIVYKLALEQSAGAAGSAAERAGSMGEMMKTIPVLMDEIFDTAGTVFLPIANAILPLVVSALRGFGDWFSANLPMIKDIVSTVVADLGAAFEFLIGTVLPPVIDAFSAIASFVVVNWPTVQAVVETVTAGISAAVSPIVDTIEGLLSTFDGAVAGIDLAGENIGVSVAGLAENVLSSIAGLAGDLIPKLAGMAAQLADWVLAALPGLLSNLADYMTTILGWLIDHLPEFVGKLTEWGAALIGWVAPRLPALLGILLDFVTKLAGWFIGTGLPKLAAALGPMAEGAINAFLDVILGRNGHLGLLANIVSFVQTDLLPGLGRLVPLLAKAGLDLAVGLGRSFANGIVGLIEGAVNAMIRGLNYLQIHIHLDLPDPLPDIGFDWWGLRLPAISLPRFQSGVRGFPGGWALLGETGPEIARLPGGTDVYDAARTRGILAELGTASGPGTKIVGMEVAEQHIDNTTPDEVERQIGRGLRRAALAWSLEGGR